MLSRRAALLGGASLLATTRATAQFGGCPPAFCSLAASNPCDPVVVLLLGFEGANGSTGAPGLLDESPAFYGLANSAASSTIETAQFKFGTSSYRMHASIGNSLRMTGDSPNWHLSAANSDQFTMEFWVRMVSFAAGRTYLSNGSNTAGNISFSIENGAAVASQVLFNFSVDGTTLIGLETTGTSIVANTWTAICVEKDSSGKIRIYINGVMAASSTPANSAFFNSTSVDGIGIMCYNTTSGRSDGWIDELRITKGKAWYASDAGYTPATAAFPRCPLCGSLIYAGLNPYDANVKLLVGFDGADGSTGAPGMTDLSPSARGTASAVGNAQIDTAQFKFGTGSVMFDGTGDSITFPASSDFTFDGQFTIEGWAMFMSSSALQGTILAHYAGIGARGWALDWVTNDHHWRFRFSTDGSTNTYFLVGDPGTPVAGTWYHWALDRDSTDKMRMYVDGVMITSQTGATGTSFNGSQLLSMGMTGDASLPYNGWVDEVRVTKGVALYACDAGFVVPSAAFPRS